VLMHLYDTMHAQALYKKFRDPTAEDAPPEFMAKLGQNRDYNVDLIPKFIMADGSCHASRS